VNVADKVIGQGVTEIGQSGVANIKIPLIYLPPVPPPSESSQVVTPSLVPCVLPSALYVFCSMVELFKPDSLLILHLWICGSCVRALSHLAYTRVLRFIGVVGMIG